MSKKKPAQTSQTSRSVSDVQELTSERLLEEIHARFDRVPTEAEMVALRAELTDPPPRAPKQVKLFEKKGDRPLGIHAQVSSAGELEIASREVISRRGGADDTVRNCYLTLSESNKDLLLLALLQQMYSGNTSLISDLREFMKAKGVRWSFGEHLDMDLK